MNAAETTDRTVLAWMRSADRSLGSDVAAARPVIAKATPESVYATKWEVDYVSEAVAGGISQRSSYTELSDGMNYRDETGQWMPVMTVKPDGTKLFVAWYDRRDDSANSLIHLYGRWATVNADGSVTFGTEFRITTASFPPVFAGTRGSPYTNRGYYDPVYPPGGVSLTWWYPEWPLTNQFGEPYTTAPTYKSHVGEYNGASADPAYVYVTWTDNRLTAQGTRQPPTPRNQGDIRFSRVPWPQ